MFQGVGAHGLCVRYNRVVEAGKLVCSVWCTEGLGV